VRALDGVDAEMGGAIVAVAHDEFRGMGLSGVSGFLGAGNGFCYRRMWGGCYSLRMNL
jgi:hypothetical protein